MVPSTGYVSCSLPATGPSLSVTPPTITPSRAAVRQLKLLGKPLLPSLYWGRRKAGGTATPTAASTSLQPRRQQVKIYLCNHHITPQAGRCEHLLPLSQVGPGKVAPLLNQWHGDWHRHPKELPGER
jgi:hypothetical protein